MNRLTLCSRKQLSSARTFYATFTYCQKNIISVTMVHFYDHTSECYQAKVISSTFPLKHQLKLIQNQLKPVSVKTFVKIANKPTNMQNKSKQTYPANIRLDEDVLRRLSSSSSEDVFKTSSRRLDQDQYVRLSLTS